MSAVTPVHTLAGKAGPPSPDSPSSSVPSSTNGDDVDEKKVQAVAFVAANAGRENNGGFVEQEELSPLHSLAAVRWQWKLAAMLCVIFLSMGSNFCGASLAPLKSTIKAEMSSVTNARYGAIASSSQIVNAILPILAGILIDYYGPTYASLCCSLCIFIGAVVIAIGGQKRSFGVLLAGNIIQGFGSTSIETAQSKLYTHWFRGTKEGNASMALMGFVFGLDIAMGRVFNLMGGQTAIPIADSTGVWYWSFWLGAIMCAITLGINVIYLCIERAMPEAARVPTGRQIARERESRGLNRDGSEKDTSGAGAGAGGDGDAGGVISFTRSRLIYLSQSFWTIPAAFWVITISQLLQAGAVGAYLSNSAEAVQLTRGTNRFTAGYTSSLSQVIPIVCTPLVGLAFDKFGRRMHVVAAVAALWVLVFSLLAYSSVHPLVPILLGSVALSANALPFIASIPLLVSSQASIGTAFGIWKAFNSSGSTIIDIAIGAIQDQTPDGGYSRVFAFLIALKAVDILYGMGYHWLDRRYFRSVLFLSEKQRIQREKRESDEQIREEEAKGLLVMKKHWTFAGIALGSALIATAYVVYIIYSYQA